MMAQGSHWAAPKGWDWGSIAQGSCVLAKTTHSQGWWPLWDERWCMIWLWLYTLLLSVRRGKIFYFPQHRHWVQGSSNIVSHAINSSWDLAHKHCRVWESNPWQPEELTMHHCTLKLPVPKLTWPPSCYYDICIHSDTQETVLNVPNLHAYIWP